MEDTKTIQLPSGGEVVLKTASPWGLMVIGL